MPLMQFQRWILTAIAASAAAMVSAAREDWGAMSIGAALLFVIALVATAWEANAPWRRAVARTDDVRAAAGECNARLIALGYLWGGVGMLAVYLLSGLNWRHGWQYGCGLVLISFLIFGYAHAMNRASSPLRTAAAIRGATRLSIAHAIVAAVGIGFLIGSGKLMSQKGDWAANHIFLAGGLALIALTIIAVRTQLMLDRPHSAQWQSTDVGPDSIPSAPPPSG